MDQHAGTAAALLNVGWVDAHERQMLAAAKLALNLSIPRQSNLGSRWQAHRQSERIKEMETV